jgi:hypothetical protein
MHVRMRFIGKALQYLESKGHDDRRLTLQVEAELVHVGDLIRHPLFPGRNVYVVAREVDFIDRCLTVWLDELPGPNHHAPNEASETHHTLEPASAAFPVTRPNISD